MQIGLHILENLLVVALQVGAGHEPDKVSSAIFRHGKVNLLVIGVGVFESGIEAWQYDFA